MGDLAKPGVATEMTCSPAAAAASTALRAALKTPGFLHDLLSADLATVGALTACEVAALYLIDGEGEAARLRLSAQRGLDEGSEQQISVLTQAQDLARRAIGTGKPVQLGEGPEGDAAGAPLAGAYSACAAVPLAAEGRTIGALLVMSRERAPLDQAACTTLVGLGSHVARTLLTVLLCEQVSDERDRYERVGANVRDCIWTYYLEPERQLALLTDGVLPLTGYARDEILTRPNPFAGLVYPDDRELGQRQFARILGGQTTDLHLRVRIVRKDGELRWTHTRGHAVRDDIGWRVDCITTDVTDHVRLEEKVRRADRLSAVGILAGGIAHEYNNLHFAILGTLDLLLMRDDLQEGVRAHVNRVREAAERASDITNKLVSFARGGNGAREVMDVDDLIEATLGMVQKEFTTKGIEVEIRPSPVALRVRGNRAELGQALMNLVINAQQAMQESPVKRLTVASGLSDGRAYLSITDTGHGISAENLPRLFDPFFTTKGAAGSWAHERAAGDAYLPGRGLGLSVAQTIVQEHGGDIEVESEVGCGTRFIVYLPPPDRGETQSLETPAMSRPRQGRILIADDEPPVREVCREWLEQSGYEVAEAGGGAEALDRLAGEDFDLVLVDLQMPDMEGLELVRRINEIPISRRPAKLIITGNIDDLPTETCSELGIAGLLQKRASLSELITKVQLVIGKRH